jgi:predicted SAM-dependent methyltransferase
MIKKFKSILRPPYYFSKKFYQWFVLVASSFSQPVPIFPILQPETTSNTNGLKLHIGCGSINLQGWINIDARLSAHIHLTTNKITLEEFLDGSAQEVYVCHFLEHFSFEECEQLLMTFYKKLHNNGTLRISVPNFDKLAELYFRTNKDLNCVKYALMGGQDYEYNFHKSVFDDSTLRSLLTKVGFSVIEEWDPKITFGPSLNDFSSCQLGNMTIKLPISLNLLARKSK